MNLPISPVSRAVAVPTLTASEPQAHLKPQPVCLSSTLRVTAQQRMLLLKNKLPKPLQRRKKQKSPLFLQVCPMSMSRKDMTALICGCRNARTALSKQLHQQTPIPLSYCTTVLLLRCHGSERSKLFWKPIWAARQSGLRRYASFTVRPILPAGCRKPSPCSWKIIHRFFLTAEREILPNTERVSLSVTGTTISKKQRCSFPSAMVSVIPTSSFPICASARTL